MSVAIKRRKVLQSLRYFNKTGMILYSTNRRIQRLMNTQPDEAKETGRVMFAYKITKGQRAWC